jgi:hypothetical protein
MSPCNSQSRNTAANSQACKPPYQAGLRVPTIVFRFFEPKIASDADLGTCPNG